VKKGTRQAITKDSDDNEHVTIVAFVTTNGDTMPPLFIFPLKNLPENLVDLLKAGKLMISGQESGWIDQATFKSWLLELAKWLKIRRLHLGLPNDAPFLLFLDSHSSREHSDILKIMQDNFIVAVTYPSHTTQLVQPMDVAVFGPFKKNYKVWIRKMVRLEIKWIGEKDPSEKSVRRCKRVLAAINALHEALVYTHVERGFRLSGLWPRDKTQTLNNPRITQNEEVTMKNSKRKRLPIVGGVITDQIHVDRLIQMEKEAEEKKKSKKAPQKKKKTEKKKASPIPLNSTNPPQNPMPLLTPEEHQFALKLYFDHKQKSTRQTAPQTNQ